MSAAARMPKKRRAAKAKLRLIKGEVKRWRRHGEPRVRPSPFLTIDLVVTIQSHHIEKARQHGWKCPIWAALREETRMPWIVCFREYEGETALWMVMKIARQKWCWRIAPESDLMCFWREYISPSGDRMAAEDWLLCDPPQIKIAHVPFKMQKI